MVQLLSNHMLWEWGMVVSQRKLKVLLIIEGMEAGFASTADVLKSSCMSLPILSLH